MEQFLFRTIVRAQLRVQIHPRSLITLAYRSDVLSTLRARFELLSSLRMPFLFRSRNHRCCVNDQKDATSEYLRLGNKGKRVNKNRSTCRRVDSTLANEDVLDLDLYSTIIVNGTRFCVLSHRCSIMAIRFGLNHRILRIINTLLVKEGNRKQGINRERSGR